MSNIINESASSLNLSSIRMVGTDRAPTDTPRSRVATDLLQQKPTTSAVNERPTDFSGPQRSSVAEEPAAVFKPSGTNYTNRNEEEKVKLQKEIEERTEERTEDNEKRMEELSSKMNELMGMIQGNDLRFRKDENSQEVVMVLIDKITEEEVRQIPSEMLLNIAQKLREFIDQNADKTEATSERVNQQGAEISAAQKDARINAYMSLSSTSRSENR